MKGKAFLLSCWQRLNRIRYQSIRIGNLRLYLKGLYRVLHFYLKPGLHYQKYFLPTDPKKSRYVEVWIRYAPFSKKGLRGLWDSYNQCMVERNRDRLESLLTEVKGMLSAAQNNGRKFHLSMSRAEQILSLKKLAMIIHFELGILDECVHDYERAIDHYDRGARMLHYEDHDWQALVDTRNRIFKATRSLLARRQEEIHYDVLIVNVGWSTEIMPWPLMVLGTRLKEEGKNVRLMDGYSEPSEILREASYADLIGYSVMTAQIRPSLSLSRQIKRLYRDKSIVWGGVHPTLYPEQCLREDSIDFVISGDGEDALTALSTCLENGEDDFHKIPGLGFKRNSDIVINPMEKPARFQDAGPWAFDLMDMSHYLNWQLMLVDFRHPSMSLLATRGCPRRCSFCINSVVRHTRIHRAKPVESVLDEIERLIKMYHVRTINFPDEAFFVNPDYFAAFVEGILERDLKFQWGGGAHISDVLRHKDLILAAKRAGLIWTGGSGESGSNRLLRLLDKQITVEETLECMHFLADNGLMTASCFMTHLPTETPEETKATLDLIEHIRKIFREKNNPSYIMGPSVFRPYPGSKLYQMCVETGFKQPETLEGWQRMIMPDGNFKIQNITWLG